MTISSEQKRLAASLSDPETEVAFAVIREAYCSDTTSEATDPPQASGELADEWRVLSARANQDTGNEGEDIAAIGIRDGYSQAVQTLDVLTGGDGEYRYSTIPSDSHCPDPPVMIRRIVARLANPSPSGERKRLLVEARKNLAITMRTMECNSDDVRTAEAIIRFLEMYA